MDFCELLDDVLTLLHQSGRVTYRALKRQFHLDDEVLDDLKEEILYGQRLAVEEDGRVLVWTGGAGAAPQPTSSPLPSGEARQVGQRTRAVPPPGAAHTPEAERRPLTVLFCDLVDSTALSSQLDPEEWREVVRAYQDTCAKVIARYEGHIAQYLGDGLLVYFGYPLAHEDDTQRAVRAGLGIVEAMGPLNARLWQDHGVQLDVRLGIHTGQVVVGEIGAEAKHEQLALGETPNLAARLQGLAEPNTVVTSAATVPLLGGFFACQSLGPHLLKGLTQPIEVYQVRSESTACSRLEAVGSIGPTPLMGREPEVALLQERWAQVKDGSGQVVLLSGEAGIGKSRLVRVLTEQVASEPQAWLTPCQCSPYYQHTALYPLIELLERVALRFEREESAEPTPLLEAHAALGTTLFYLGEYAAARAHLEQGIVLTDPAAQRALGFSHGYAPGVSCHALVANTLWCLGYPAQAVRRSQEALAQHYAAILHDRRREGPIVQAQAEAFLTLAAAQEFPLYVGLGTFWRGKALALQGQGNVGLTQMHEGLTAVVATGLTLAQPLCLVPLAEAVGKAGQIVEGLRLLSEALAAFEANEQGDGLPEVYRLQGEFLLCHTVPDAGLSEACFHQALAIARCQQAKSWELRAAMSLARLWQQQGKRAEAHALLAPIYGWFTEGFDSADLREARALLETLGG